MNKIRTLIKLCIQISSGAIFLISTSVQAADRLWNTIGTQWEGFHHYATPLDACDSHYLFRPSYSTPYLNPTTYPEPLDANFEYCFGTNPTDGVQRYLSTVFSNSCTNISPTHPRYFLCHHKDDDDPVKDDGDDCNLLDNPCNVATGNKYRSETDFSNKNLSFVRSYNSNNLVDLGMGVGWRGNFQKALFIKVDELTQISKSGRGEPWIKVNGNWQGDPDSDITITEDSTGYQIIKENGAAENYDLSGKILSETDTNGHQTTYSYNADDQLSQVSNHYGQSLNFSYSGTNLETVTDALGQVYRYEYNDEYKNLVAVVFPDNTPSDDTDNPSKIYHYENTSYPNHLTGITDENGDRYAIFAYDAAGKAILSELGTTSNPVGQQKIGLDYQGAN